MSKVCSGLLAIVFPVPPNFQSIPTSKSFPSNDPKSPIILVYT